MPIPALFLRAFGTAFWISDHASNFYLSLILIVATSFHSSINVFHGYFDFKIGKYTADEGKPNYAWAIKEELKFPSRFKRPSTN
jgi:1,4-dihydroxy-2-naphthoate octaprenyltransferase